MSSAPAVARMVRPMNITSNQRLMPSPGRSQRRSRRHRPSLPLGHRRLRSSSRCHTVHRAHVQPTELDRERLADGDRPVEATGAADGDGQARLALGQIGRDDGVEERVEVLQEPLG